MSVENNENTEIEKDQKGGNGTRPPFAPGNLVALKIGSRSPRVYGPVAERIAEDLLESRPDLGEFPEELAALATTEAVVAMLRIHIMSGVAGKDGQLRVALIDRYFAAERAAAKRRDAVGLSPIGEAVLGRERAATAALAAGAAVDLEALARRGRAALDAREDIAVTTVAEVRAAAARSFGAVAELHAEKLVNEKQKEERP